MLGQEEPALMASYVMQLMPSGRGVCTKPVSRLHDLYTHGLGREIYKKPVKSILLL